MRASVKTTRNAYDRPVERRTQADVLAEPERDVLPWLAQHTDLLGVGAERRLVAVGRRVEHEQAIAFADPPAVQLDVARRRPHEAADRRSPAQHLLDGA